MGVGVLAPLVPLADGGFVLALELTLSVWDPRTAAFMARKLCGHIDKLTCLVVAADDRVVSGGKDATLRVWHPHTGSCERVLDCGKGAVVCLAALAGGCSVVSGSEDGSLRIWCVDDGVCTFILLADGGPVSALMVDGERFVSVSLTKSYENTACILRFWNAGTGKCEHTLERPGTENVRLVTLGRGRMLLCDELPAPAPTTDAPGNRPAHAVLHVCAVSTGALEPRMLRGLGVNALVTLSGSRVVFAADNARSLHVWNVAVTGAALPQLSAQRAGAVKQLAVLAGGRVLSISVLDPHVHVWSAHGVRLPSLAGALPPLFDGVELQECADGCFTATTSSLKQDLSWSYAGSLSDGITFTHTASAHVWTAAGALLCEETVVSTAFVSLQNVSEDEYRKKAEDEVLQLRQRLHACGPRSADDVLVSADAVSHSGSSLSGEGITRMYLGDAITARACFELRGGGGDGETTKVVVVGTAGGAVHFFHVMPPAWSSSHPP
jgi:hypothetical protein